MEQWSRRSRVQSQFNFGYLTFAVATFVKYIGLGLGLQFGFMFYVLELGVGLGLCCYFSLFFSHPPPPLLSSLFFSLLLFFFLFFSPSFPLSLSHSPVVFSLYGTLYFFLCVSVSVFLALLLDLPVSVVYTQLFSPSFPPLSFLSPLFFYLSVSLSGSLALLPFLPVSVS